MADHSAASNTPDTSVSKSIQAPRQAVYQAFLDPSALEAWLPPDEMQCHVHHIEPREGGTFRI